MGGKHLSTKKRILPSRGSHTPAHTKRKVQEVAPDLSSLAPTPAPPPAEKRVKAPEVPKVPEEKKVKAPKAPKAPKEPKEPKEPKAPKEKKVKPPKEPKAPKEKKASKGSAVGIIFRLIIGVLVAAVLLLNIFTYVFSVVNYYGDSMEPTLSGGQTLVILRTAKIEEGDLVAFYYNNKVIVRRVICTGDKQISIADDGVVSINGEVIMEDYVQELSLGQCDISFPYSVPGGRYFVMGDNRSESMDSRLEIIGAISPDRIIGKILFVK